MNAPADDYTSSVSSVTFNATVASIRQIANVSLILDGAVSQTNFSGIDNGDYLFTSDLADGNYLWAYQACDVSDSCATSQVQSLTVSTSGGNNGGTGGSPSGSSGSGGGSGTPYVVGNSNISSTPTEYSFYPNIPITILINVAGLDLQS